MRRIWSAVVPSWNALDRAEKLRAEYSLSFWDALVVGTCLDAGVRRLVSEDFTGYRLIGSLEIMNPFQSSG